VDGKEEKGGGGNLGVAHPLVKEGLGGQGVGGDVGGLGQQHVGGVVHTGVIHQCSPAEDFLFQGHISLKGESVVAMVVPFVFTVIALATATPKLKQLSGSRDIGCEALAL